MGEKKSSRDLDEDRIRTEEGVRQVSPQPGATDFSGYVDERPIWDLHSA